MKKILPFVVVVFLVGCTLGVKNSPPLAIYDFGLPASLLESSIDSGNVDMPGEWSWLGLEVTSPVWLESPDIRYRLLYEDPLKLRQYAQSRWAGAPGTLLVRFLRREFGFGGSDNALVHCRLVIELQEFSHVFSTPERSRGVVYAMVRLLNSQRQAMVEQRYLVEFPAPAADAAGGVHALIGASRDFGRQLSGWLTALDAKNRLARCRPVAALPAR